VSSRASPRSLGKKDEEDEEKAEEYFSGGCARSADDPRAVSPPANRERTFKATRVSRGFKRLSRLTLS